MPPCTATERYTLAFDSRQLPTLRTELVWRATLQVQCRTCHSKDDVWVYPANQLTGEVTKLQGP
ncbi:MAG: hypothetical protein H0X17_00270 [Deltaproteobacteria bacterium]|nr:hypothetical protein [Deltaproteobacteria bacterium]